MKRKATSQGGRKGKRTWRFSPASRVAANATTLAKVPTPFPPKKLTYLTYESNLSPAISPITGITGVVRIVATGLYDIDYDNYLGNKQPLYFDQLVSTNGPYRYYKVISWKTTWTIINNNDVALNVVVFPGSSDPTDIDSIGESSNMPGTKLVALTQKTGARNMATCTMTGNYKDVWASQTGDNGVLGTFSANPGNSVYAGLVAFHPDLTTVPSFHVAVKHECFVELTNYDATLS